MPSIHNLWFHGVDRVRTTNDRTFWIGFACAGLLHMALIFGASSSTPRQLGRGKDGLQDAISVEFVEPSAVADNAGPHEGEASAEQSSNSALQVPRPAADTDAWQTELGTRQTGAPLERGQAAAAGDAVAARSGSAASGGSSEGT